MPFTPASQRQLHTRPSKIQIQIDRHCDADLERSAGFERKPDFPTLQLLDSNKIEFPQTASRDDASDASIEMGAVHITRLSSPMDALGESIKRTITASPI